MNEEKMDAERLADIIDGMLEKGKVQMLITLPEGSMDAEIKSNVDLLGPTGHFYILLHALKSVFLEFAEKLDDAKKEEFIDSVLQMVKDELMEEDGE